MDLYSQPTKLIHWGTRERLNNHCNYNVWSDKEWWLFFSHLCNQGLVRHFKVSQNLVSCIWQHTQLNGATFIWLKWYQVMDHFLKVQYCLQATSWVCALTSPAIHVLHVIVSLVHKPHERVYLWLSIKTSATRHGSITYSYNIATQVWWTSALLSNKHAWSQQHSVSKV